MEQGELQEFFDSRTPSECRRLLILFYDMMLVNEPIQERDWSDKSGDGQLKSSPPVTRRFLRARNGQ